MDRIFVRWVLFVCCSFLISCTPSKREELGKSIWKASECSLFSALGCAGQAVGICSIQEDDGFDDFGDCLIDNTPNCIGENLAKCAISGIMRATGSSVFGGGGVSCTTPENRDRVRDCMRERDPHNEAQAVEAVGQCWVEICELD